ncbi:MAG: hypothetical protein PUE27_07405 [Sharpea porci]|uniref:hypothetical protein n=1 Tax=Sharpea porci TaxID=2652286 RepID=UPI00240A4115|nr:hypothetical protein [Sharpea porci]MDD6711887.1 hypothetical protein [Sharpea porci]
MEKLKKLIYGKYQFLIIGVYAFFMFLDKCVVKDNAVFIAIMRVVNDIMYVYLFLLALCFFYDMWKEKRDKH